jgi:hypothetical protein
MQVRQSVTILGSSERSKMEGKRTNDEETAVVAMKRSRQEIVPSDGRGGHIIQSVRHRNCSLI